MAVVEYKLVSDPTFNDYLGTLKFNYGICEVDTDDSGVMQRIKDLGMIGFQIEPLEGLPVEEKTASVKRKKRKKKRKRKKPASKPAVKEVVSEPEQEEATDLIESNYIEPTGGNIEQTENKPEHDGEGRSGDDREDDPFSQADSQ